MDGDGRELAATVARSFSESICKFNLRCVPVSNDECLLIGNGYALSIGLDREGLDIRYIAKTNTDWRSYRITNYLVTQRLSADDSAKYGSPTTYGDRILSSLRVFVSGLQNRGQDILSGDDSWLKELKRRDPDSWVGTVTSRKYSLILDPTR